ncbi:MAG: phosphate signaling complex protein PhoU [Candidatus Dadabacteria bacterium]|nr:phosphate signaling complex protein PhoU [Candidatus Dadabacteria bacterium]MDE0158662.1 phosphate signaling complex protein PhoU [Candidatus Dadabacteria bacterium]MDE0292177.1 phosphate signaling complex protein PhoU [Candidatus Dadabacteria bacterium]MDE0476956.1 phosphate signaling complex protein PhoU [Candidatus Dadabacteria bacterium]MDE0663117.1 phosphate signaling complex protein PhoU [Candidatus Dadabacteria bacterium]
MIKYQGELVLLNKKLLEMASLVETMIAKSIKALREGNMILAQEVISTDDQVNSMEIEIDNLCIKILALYQPEATDLRTVTMIMKVNNDLERIGDHASSISRLALFMADYPPIKPLIDIPKMADKAMEMLREALDAFIRSDERLAVEVCRKDDEVDNYEPQIVRELITFVISDPSTLNRALRYIYVARHLERVADLATNIAENAYYIATGEMLKHQHTSEMN